MISVSPIYVGLAALLLVVLSLQVSRLRYRHGVSLGDGGHAELLRAIRVHANFAEYTPLALLVVVAVDLVGHAEWIVHGLGVALIVGRICHAYGLMREPGLSAGRSIGTALTWLVLVVGAALAIVGSFNVRL